MATGLAQGVPDNLRKKLALAVRSIQWSYAIFWSTSARQPGVLEWGDGYYNGDIKTRKTVQALELSSNQMGLQRSEQLSELYESLAAGEGSPQARRPSAALSPEDLSDTEWYYLVCMSFVFNIGQGLPGRTLANGRLFWLCNAHFADSKVFSRSLLAKSASIQTVVCFPFLGGVVELGVTELILEDPGLIQHVKTSFLEVPYPIVSTNMNSAVLNQSCNQDISPAMPEQEVLDTKLIKNAGCGELAMASPNNSSNGLQPNQQAGDSFKDMNGAASQARSWLFMDEELSNCVHHSMNSSDCISQTFAEPENCNSFPHGERVDNHCLPDQGLNHGKLASWDLRNNDVHYQSVLSVILKTSHQLLLGPDSQNTHQKSSFTSWKKEVLSLQKPRSVPQALLKKVLLEVPRMHAGGFSGIPETNGCKTAAWRLAAEENGINHATSEKRRHEKLNERFLTLRSLVPSGRKDDKVLILDEVIDYLKELERRVEELESGKEPTHSEGRARRRPQDTVERTSDNYGNNKAVNGCRHNITKRKASDIDETGADIKNMLSGDGSTDNILVCISNKEVVIEMRCPWRDGILLEIIEVASDLRLDSHSVQSSATDGVLSLSIKAKLNSSSVASIGMIKQALQRVAKNC